VKNVFACAVHESPECVADLVRNLAYLDPDSTILLYNGGPDAALLGHGFWADGSAPLVHPAPRRLTWGALHEFALDCMRFALEEVEFDSLTIVDSDQLLVRPGYSRALAAAPSDRGAVGMLGSAPGQQPPTTQVPPARVAWHELDLWLPFLRRFPRGEEIFPNWTFWPSTVFLRDACRDLVQLYDSDEQLAEIMSASRIWATEEVVLPTLVALLGYEVVRNPRSYDFVRYRAAYTPSELVLAMERPDVVWVHPVPRAYAHPLRRTLRARYGGYASATKGPTTDAAADLRVLERMRTVEGWLSEGEAELLIAGLARAASELGSPPVVVEVGSYCGRSTIVLADAVKALGRAGRVYAIDPHDGQVGALGQGLLQTPPTLEKFRRTIEEHGCADVVELIQRRSYETSWYRPISFLLVDGLHDYVNVSRDLGHFEPWLRGGAFVAFHDYADYYPGVKALVDELVAYRGYERVECVESMVLLRRRAATARTAPRRPLVSCVMPTYDRPALAAAAAQRFLRQEGVDAELIVVDDGPCAAASHLPSDPRVRHLRLDRRESIGAKRNIGCEAAGGELLANWDDDDWYAPWRLAYQAQALAESGADVCGLTKLLCLEPAHARAWRYSWPEHPPAWLHDATLVMSRDFWLSHPFPKTSWGIDAALLGSARGRRVVALPNERFYVGMIHRRNTSPKDTSGEVWQPHPLEDVEQLLGEDAAFFARAFADGGRTRSA
jgi:predicted O-methyltransferase YrrM